MAPNLTLTTPKIPTIKELEQANVGKRHSIALVSMSRISYTSLFTRLGKLAATT